MIQYQIQLPNIGVMVNKNIKKLPISSMIVPESVPTKSAEVCKSGKVLEARGFGT
jgi:hypothetical protein